ncbi:hypothetical protein [Vibrio hepatarius]|uniref:hypothetical protein n=1 Tax=Vibrio hepatarius TaxID=171383 RepID=UPI00142DA9A4|nr:hypothetical protein [Vibrio hepatarius]NIY82217.1 hypothetical protein [Vibrio hepatarius]NVJ55726.1 hypothetical protein [Vibrionaceae bacterium]
MFVLISISISLIILAGLFHFSKQRQSSLKRKYEILVLLRQLLLLSRQHRSITHLILSKTDKFDMTPQLEETYDSMMAKSSELIAIAHFENKPMYRILQLKLKSLNKDWQNNSVARNQVVHGKTIRHCLFLMDEIAIAWLIESGREDLSDEYHLNWQQVLDSMEVLTQLRIAIQDCHYPEGMLRVKYYCEKMKRKLNQMSIISPLALASPVSSKSMHMLTEIGSCNEITMEVRELYLLTTDISLIISQVYDQMLSDMTESLYQPLPRVAFSG